MVATGAMETEVMVKGALGVVIGALVVVVVVVDTEVEDTLLVATETAGKDFVASPNQPPLNTLTLFAFVCSIVSSSLLFSRGQGGYGDRSGSYRDGYDGYGKHQ